MSKPDSKPRKTIKLTPGKRRQFERALADLRTHYGTLAEAWPQLTAEQQRAVLDASPVLAAYVQFFGTFEAVR